MSRDVEAALDRQRGAVVVVEPQRGVERIALVLDHVDVVARALEVGGHAKQHVAGLVERPTTSNHGFHRPKPPAMTPASADGTAVGSFETELMMPLTGPKPPW